MPFYFSNSNNLNFYSLVNGFKHPAEYLTKTNIVTNDLVLSLDAGDVLSYPRSGTTWTDLSGRGNTGTLINGPTYNSANGGSIVFDGVDDYVNIPFNAPSMNFSLYQTICMWLRPTTGTFDARRNPYNQAYGGSGTLTIEQNGTITYFFGTNGGDSTPYVGRASSFSLEINQICHIAVTRNQVTNVTRWYRNGDLSNSSDAGGYAATSNGSSPITIGDGYVSGFLGNIYDCKVYNRELTSDEILQNFGAMRQRFGI